MQISKVIHLIEISFYKDFMINNLTISQISLNLLFVSPFITQPILGNSKFNSFNNIRCAKSFYSFLYSTMLYDHQYTKGACYSDIPFHTNIIMSCIMGCNSKKKFFNKSDKLMSVFFAGEPLAYSIMPDWYSSSLMLSGFTSVRYALLIPSLFVMFSLIVSFYSLTYYYSKSHFVSSLSFIIKIVNS